MSVGGGRDARTPFTLRKKNDKGGGGKNGLQKQGSDLLEHDHRSLSTNNVLKGKINSPLAEQAEAPVNERTHQGL